MGLFNSVSTQKQDIQEIHDVSALTISSTRVTGERVQDYP
jgi:hypothetical protein